MPAEKLEKCPWCGEYPIERPAILACINMKCPVQPCVQADNRPKEVYAMWHVLCVHMGDRSKRKEKEA